MTDRLLFSTQIYLVLVTVDWVFIGWLDLLTPYTINSYLQAIERCRWFTHFKVPRYTRTRNLNIQWSYPSNGIKTVSLLLRKSSNYPLTLQGLTSNSSSTTNFPWLSLTTNELSSQTRTLCCTPFYSHSSESASSECASESYVTTDGQSASLSWNKAPI
jgi:hypothetical protein